MMRTVSKWIAPAFILLALGAAMPAQAQSFSFGFRFGDERTDMFPHRVVCLTDRQIRDAIARRGYSNIYLNVPNEQRIQVRASRDGWVYLLDFDFCRDRIRGARQLRPAR